jgi:sialate O-acetylesterase
MVRRTWVLAGVMILVLSAAAWSDVALPSLFQDSMVLQRGMKCPVWGTAAPGEAVTVEIAGKKYEAKADEKGAWRVNLDSMEAGGPLVMTVTGKNTLTGSDILVGEVWLCSGQSNMSEPVNTSLNSAEERTAANYPKIRLFKVPGGGAETPQPEVRGRWAICSRSSVGGWSSAAYYFGRDLFKELDVPIGLIQSAVGGTPAESWTPASAMDADAELRSIMVNWRKSMEGYPEQKKAYDAAVEEWKKACEKATAEKGKLPEKPKEPKGPTSSGAPAILYNGMIHPLAPYAIRGAIWYQGEANTDRAERYPRLLSTMIASWRQVWGEGDFAFGIVQLANFQAVRPEPGESGWAELREAQVKVANTVPNCGLAVIIDAGEADNIHPKNKQAVGKRLSLWAIAKVYGKTIEYSGPVFDAVKIEGAKARITFKHVGRGLVAGAPESKVAEALKGFAIAGANGKFVWADAKIEGDAIVVSSDKVAEPKAVRYAWASNPICNLYNKDGLPAVPFRTDGR